MRWLVVIGLLASAGCLRQTEYQCSGNSSACGAQGQCEASGYCSFPDAECSSGRRYHDTAGALAGQCTNGGSPLDDAGVPLDDARSTPMDGQPMTDAPPMAVCPAGYVALTGGQPGHLYKVVTTTDRWLDQHMACRATTASAYLAIPDDEAELIAMDTAIGAGNTYWVGISDRDVEMQWRTVLDATPTYLPWQPGSPDDPNGNEDCVAANSTTHTIDDVRCNQNRPAICECAP